MPALDNLSHNLPSAGDLVSFSKLLLEIQACDTLNSLADKTMEVVRDIIQAQEVAWLEVASTGDKLLFSKPESNQFKDAFADPQLHSLIKQLAAREDDQLLWIDHTDIAKYVLAFQAYSSKGAALIIVASLQKKPSSETLTCLGCVRDHLRSACSKILKLASSTSTTMALQQMRVSDKKIGISVLSADARKLWDVDDHAAHILKEMGYRPESSDSKNEWIVNGDLAAWSRQILEEEPRLAARCEKFEREFSLKGKRKAEVTIFPERAGLGALMVLATPTRSTTPATTSGESATHRFTRRENEVIGCIMSGKSSQEVSDELKISKRTVDKHLENIYVKLGVNNRLAAMNKLQNLGVIG